MNNKDPYTEIAEVFGIKDLAPQIYKDLLQPTAQEVGKNLLTVAKCVAISLAPLEATVWGYANIKAWLCAKLVSKFANKKPEDIQTPSPLIAGPVLLNLTFAANEKDLREMYACLLAAAMDKKNCHNSHPSFAYVLQQLSPDEALIIKELKTIKPGQLICSARVDYEHGTVSEGEKGVHRQFEDFCETIPLQNRGLIYTYLENLIRLNILGNLSYSDAELIPEGGNDYGTWEAYLEHASRETIYISSFGETFISACVE